MFLPFCFGRITSLMPRRRAASTFSLMPPTGSTRPDNVISPVISTSLRTGQPVNCEAMAVAMVTPADGRPGHRVLLQAMRDSHITFRGFDSNAGDARLENYGEMDLDQYLYMEGEVCRLFR